MAENGGYDDEKSRLLSETSNGINSDLHGGQSFKKESKIMLFVYMVLLIICGSAMTLVITFQDEICVKYKSYDGEPETPASYPTSSPSFFKVLFFSDSDEDGECERYFHQPFIQLFQMGVGQFLSGLTFPFFRYRPGDSTIPLGNPSFLEFAPKAGLASLFDAMAEIFIILGINLSNPSTAEMMKATLVVFVGLVSTRFFPGFSLSWKQWLATGLMLVGAGLVIMKEYLGVSGANALSEVAGACLCLGAQMFYAMQFVVEEKLMDDCKVKNLHVNKGLLVLCEGVVSMLAGVILQIPYTALIDGEGYDGFTSDIYSYFHIPELYVSGLGLSVAVAGFDLFGLLTAEHMGSDLRAVVCASFQVVLVWTLAVLLKLEEFTVLYDIVGVAGFVIILGAGFLYAATAKPKAGPHSSHAKEHLQDIA